MLQFHTEFSGYSVEFSPFDETRLACATAQHFGIVGNGRQYVLTTAGGPGAPGGLQPLAAFDSRDGLFDCTWSEENESVVAAGCGDGSIKLWDSLAPSGRPIQLLREHTKEVYSVDWNLVAKDTLLSGSWDFTIKLWSPRAVRSLATFAEHQHSVYSAIWSPSNPEQFASASGDHTLKIWDINEPHSVQTILAHEGEVLSCDWNKYNDFIVVSGAVDRTIRVWDIRNARRPLSTLHGHSLAVRRVKCSPHSETVMASCSYDMSVILWDLQRELDDPLQRKFEHHTEFVVGIDFNLFFEGQIATCSWDETVDVIPL